MIEKGSSINNPISYILLASPCEQYIRSFFYEESSDKIQLINQKIKRTRKGTESRPLETKKIYIKKKKNKPARTYVIKPDPKSHYYNTTK